MMAWSTHYNHILKANTTEWAQTKGKEEERANLVKRVAVEIKSKQQEDHSEDPIPVDLQKVCEIQEYVTS